MSNYPAQIDNSISLPQVVDNSTPVQASTVNNLRDAILAIEAALGTNPNGLYSNVGNRLTTLEGLIANTPIIQITQDLGGTPDSPLVIGIQGRPVADTGPSTGQALVWNGIAWVPTTLNTSGAGFNFGGDLAGNAISQTVIGIQGKPVSAVAPLTSQVLTFNGTSWAPASASQAPLSRASWIDVGTSHPGNGDIGTPYPSIGAWTTAIGVPTTSADASTDILGLVTPGNYSEEIVIPAYRNIELRGTHKWPDTDTIIGDITWNNVAGGGAVAPSGRAMLTIYNISLNEGNVTITDDGSVSSYLYIGRDIITKNTSDIFNLNATSASALVSVTISNTSLFAISVNSSTTLNMDNCVIASNVGSPTQFTATDCTFRPLTIHAVFPTFLGCTFGGTSIVVPSGGQWVFDGPSWRSFREGGGTLTFSDLTNGSIFVVGGYLGGEVVGTNYIDSASTTVVSLDGTGATTGYQNGGNHYTVPAATLAGDFRVLQLSTGSASDGDTIMVTRQDISGYRFLVKNHAGTTILTMPGWRTNFGLFTYSSGLGDWVLTSSGGNNNPSYNSSSALTINHSSSATTLLAWNVAKVDTTGGAPPSITTPTTTAVLDLDRFTVIDTQANFGTTPCAITAAAGETIEDPNSPGTFSSTVTLSATSAAVEWIYDLTNTRWKVI